MWIVLEGPDGVGKDVQISLITKKLFSLGKEYVVVKDPSPDVAQEIRNVLLTKESENSTRLYLYLAARAELLNKQIIPALKANKIVLCNRYDLSTYCYQGVFFPYEEIKLASQIGKLDYPKPDLQIIYLSKLPLGEKENNVMDDYCEEYRTKIIHNYLRLSQTEPNINVIWVDNSPEKIFQQTWSIIEKYKEKGFDI